MSFLSFSKSYSKSYFPKTFVSFFLCFFVVFLVQTFFSCSKEPLVSTQTKLEQIDALMQTGQTRQALEELNILTKKKMSTPVTIGVIGRYEKLGERQKAIDILQKALKKDSRQEEYNALYLNFLLQQDDLQDAQIYAQRLQETKYQGLCAELSLKQAQESSSPYDASNIDIFLEAFSSDDTSMWLENAAIIYMTKGMYRQAFELLVQDVYSKKEALFWALVCYDAKEFDSCLQLLASYFKFVSSAPDSLDFEAVALQNDIYLKQGKEDLADEARLDLLKTLFQKDVTPSSSDRSLPLILQNSVFWAKKHNLPSQRYHLLMQLINYYPHYMAGLVSYANYALDSSLWQETDKMKQELRSKGRKTSSMQVFDDIPKISIQEATQKLDTISLSLPSSAPDIEVLKQILQDEYDMYMKQRQEETQDAKSSSSLWELQEKYVYQDSSPNENVANYSTYALIREGKMKEAQALLQYYLAKKYEKRQNQLPQENPNDFETWECSYSAFFYLLQKKVVAAKRLYEYLAFERQDVFSPEVYANLALIYYYENDLHKALDLYNMAAGKTYEPILKAELLYRGAAVLVDLKDDASAIHALEYCLEMNPQNVRARSLLKRCKQQEDN